MWCAYAYVGYVGYMGSINIWNNAFTDEWYSNKNIPATSQVDSFNDGSHSCYVLEKVYSATSTSPVGISCVKN